MSAAPMKASLPPGIELVGGYVVRVTALNPTTGATDTSVVVSDISMQVDVADVDSDAEGVEPFVPEFVYSGGA